jgi:hypothetical protein
VKRWLCAFALPLLPNCLFKQHLRWKNLLYQVIALHHIYRSLKILLKMKGNEILAKALNESAKKYLQKQQLLFYTIHLVKHSYIYKSKFWYLHQNKILQKRVVSFYKYTKVALCLV